MPKQNLLPASFFDNENVIPPEWPVDPKETPRQLLRENRNTIEARVAYRDEVCQNCKTNRGFRLGVCGPCSKKKTTKTNQTGREVEGEDQQTEECRYNQWDCPPCLLPFGSRESEDSLRLLVAAWIGRIKKNLIPLAPKFFREDEHLVSLAMSEVIELKAMSPKSRLAPGLRDAQAEQGDAGLRSYLCNTYKNCVIKMIRDLFLPLPPDGESERSVEKQRYLGDVLGQLIYLRGQGAFAGDQKIEAKLFECAKSLSELEATVLHLRFIKDMKDAEIAEKLGLEVNKVYQVLASAKNRVRHKAAELELEIDLL